MRHPHQTTVTLGRRKNFTELRSDVDSAFFPRPVFPTPRRRNSTKQWSVTGLSPTSKEADHGSDGRGPVPIQCGILDLTRRHERRGPQLDETRVNEKQALRRVA